MGRRRDPEELKHRLAEEIAPIRLPRMDLPTVTVQHRGLTRTVVFSDTHFPLQDDRVLSILLQIIQDWSPHVVIANGDLPDLNELSKHPKDLSEKWGLLDERKAMHGFLYELHKVLPRNALLYETNANHSGNGPESRWSRYLGERIGEIASLPGIRQAVRYDKIWYPDEPWCRMKLVDTVTVTKGLLAIHGDLVRPKAGYSARGMLEKYRVNLVMGHVHRMGYTGYRVPALAGQREHQMRAYEGGCCCRLDPIYVRSPDWQQGLTLIVSDDAGHFNVEQVMVHDGTAVSTTLGKRYRA